MKRPHSMMGFTLIELMVVLVLMGVMATVAAPSFRRNVAQRQVTEASSDLMASVLQARNEAISNNQQSVVQPLDNSDWSRGWRIYVDSNRDKAYTAGTDQLVATVPAKATQVQQHAVSLDAAVGNMLVFNASGYLVGSATGRVVFSSSNIPSSEYTKGVQVSRMGRARICEKTGCAGAD